MDSNSKRSKRHKQKSRPGNIKPEAPQADAALTTASRPAVSRPGPKKPEALDPEDDRDGALFLAVLGLLVLVCGVFMHTKTFGFLNFDDNQYIQEIQEVCSGLNWASIKWAWTHSHVGQWHPLTSMSFMLDSELDGLKTGSGFHIQNVLHQTIASVLLLFALRSLTGSIWRSAIAAAIFAIHPLRAESVAWVTERKDVLSGVFLMATLWAYSFYTKCTIPKSRHLTISALLAPLLVITLCYSAGQSALFQSRIPSFLKPLSALQPELVGAILFILLIPIIVLSFMWAGAPYTIVCILFALGLLSKPMLVSLPFVFLLLDIWPLNRLSWEKVPTTSEEWLAFWHRLWPLVREKIPIFLMAFASAAGAIIAVGTPFRPIPILDLLPRLKYIPLSYTTYVWQFFYPFNLSAHYPFVAQGPETWKVVACTLFLLLVTFLAWNRRNQHPYFLVGWLWFLGTMLPVIGLVPGGIQIMADRYTYLTQIGFAVALVWGISNWMERGILPIRKAVAGAIATCAILILSVAAYKQADHWKTDKDLWTHALAVTKDNDYANEKLATALQTLGQKDEAEVLYREAIRLNPRLVGSLNNLSIIVRSKGLFDEGAELQQRAVNEHPTWGLMYRNLGTARIQQKKFPEAKAAFEKAMELAISANPQFPDLESEFNLGLLLSEYIGGKENIEEAEKHFENITTRQPNATEAHFNRGNCLYRLNRMDEAIRSYQATLKLAPIHAKAANNLAAIFAAQKRITEAIPLYKQAAAADPNYIEPARNLAEALALVNAYAEAVQVWREILNRKSDDLQSIFRLAWILATCPDGSIRRPFESRDLSLKAIEMTGGKEAPLFDSLAAAYAQIGNFEEAVANAQKAVEMSKNIPGNAAAMQQRLDLYLNQKPFIEPVHPAQ
ncbi:MAG: tetratricopeptide repeat protein [Verrucomicrobiota bacterium]